MTASLRLFGVRDIEDTSAAQIIEAEVVVAEATTEAGTKLESQAVVVKREHATAFEDNELMIVSSRQLTRVGTSAVNTSVDAAMTSSVLDIAERERKEARLQLRREEWSSRGRRWL